MLILSVDTSLPLFSVALTRGREAIAAYSAEGKGSRNEKLLAAIDWMLGEASVDRREIDLVVVTRGPGSFTGVRVGLATVEGMAFALGCRVVAISTHEAALGDSREELLVWSDAGRGEHYVAGFRGGEEALAPSLVDDGELQRLRGEYSESLRLEELIESRNLALLGARRGSLLAEEGRLDANSDTTPIYVRLAEAEVKLRQRMDG